jgi:hypothetical protein
MKAPKRHDRYSLPEIGWPVYDLRRRKFGICIDHEGMQAIVHVEGDYYPVRVNLEMPEYEWPEFYINDEVSWTHMVPEGLENPPYMTEELGYFIKHAHYHVPKDVWEYTISKLGIKGFDRFVVTGKELKLIKRFEPKI